MSTSSARIWHRIVDSFRTKNGAGASDQIRGLDLNADALRQTVSLERGDRSGAERPSSPSPLIRWPRRSPSLSQVQANYEKVSQMIEEVREHLVSQGQRTERICDSLEKLAAALHDHPATSQQQSKMLETIAGQLETSNERTRHLSETIQEIPRLTDTQNQALSRISQHLEIAGEHNMLTTQTMQKIGETIATLGATNSAQAQALQKMQERTSNQNDALQGVIRAQSRRFMLLFVLTVVVALSAVAVSLAGKLGYF